MATIAFATGRSISPVLLSVGISAAALYRSIEKWHPTVVIDEADEAFVDNPDLRQVVNSGWTRGQGVVRCDPDTNEPRKFSTFCPKAIASKGRKAPDTILSRSIFITQKRRTKDETVAHFSHVDDEGFVRLRRQLARWAADNGESLGHARPSMPDGFMNRTASNWQLMFAIADSLGEEAGRRARAAAQEIVGASDLASAGVELLADIKAMGSPLDHLTSKAIVAGLTADPEKRWAEWSRGRPITEKGIGGLLREYRILSKTVGPKGAEAKGYRKCDFVDAWDRYLTVEKEIPPSDPDILPSKRRTPCSTKAFAENSAVEDSLIQREKIDGFSSGINTVDVSTGENPEIGPSPKFTASDHGLALPLDLDRTKGNGPHTWPAVRRCDHCGQPATPANPLHPYDWPGRPDGIRLHGRCEEPWHDTTADKHVSQRLS